MKPNWLWKTVHFAHYSEQDCLFSVWGMLFGKQFKTFFKDGECPYSGTISVIYLLWYKISILIQLCLHFG